MPSTGELQPRKIYVQDLDMTETRGETTTATVLGLGAGTPVTKCDFLRFANLDSYADDTAAASGGVGIGYAYWNSTAGAMKIRMT